MPEVIKSLEFDQHIIMKNINTLHLNGEGFDVDATAGSLVMHGDNPPRLAFDINPQIPGVIQAKCEELPLRDASIKSLALDPPFLTYVRQEREGNGNMIMARRFAGYWRYDELEEHYKAMLVEAARVLEHKGVLVFKCQDIVHNHAIHLTHARVLEWAHEAGFRDLDLFVLGASHRMPAPNRKGKQKHARSFHSYFLVFKRWRK